MQDRLVEDTDDDRLLVNEPGALPSRSLAVRFPSGLAGPSRLAPPRTLPGGLEWSIEKCPWPPQKLNEHLRVQAGPLTEAERPLSPTDLLELPAKEAFGVEPPHHVASVKELEVGALRERISSAAIVSAIDIALLIAGRAQEASSRTITSVTGGEGSRDYMVTVEDRGYLDDSLLGHRVRIWVTRTDDAEWKLERALWSRIGRSDI